MASNKAVTPAPQWCDISIPLQENMVRWPGDPPVRIEHTLDMEKGDSCNLSQLNMGSHSGTHMDAPFHFLKAGQGIDKIPLDVIIGSARVLEIASPKSIDVIELADRQIQTGERILFKTRNSGYAWQSPHFVEDFVSLTKEAAKYLVSRHVKLVGIDYLSIGGFRDDGDEIHRILLKAGIWILEGINLAAITPGKYELICLPLRIVKGDGAPARAILKAYSN